MLNTLNEKSKISLYMKYRLKDEYENIGKGLEKTLRYFWGSNRFDVQGFLDLDRALHTFCPTAYLLFYSSRLNSIDSKFTLIFLNLLCYKFLYTIF